MTGNIFFLFLLWYLHIYFSILTKKIRTMKLIFNKTLLCFHILYWSNLNWIIPILLKTKTYTILVTTECSVGEKFFPREAHQSVIKYQMVSHKYIKSIWKRIREPCKTVWREAKEGRNCNYITISKFTKLSFKMMEIIIGRGFCIAKPWSKFKS